MRCVADINQYFRRPEMVLKNVFFAIVSAALLASSGPLAADEYRPDEFLGLDLSRAVLSPKPLGPAAEFAPVPVEAGADRGSERARAEMEPKAEPKTQPRIAVRKVHVAKVHVAHVRTVKPRAAVPTRLARRHGNPLDAQASIARIQVWPCRSGGICSWRR
jgi:hypothetical protein